jgi:hypothetical protein
MDIIDERPPLPYLAALRAMVRCSASTARLLWQHWGATLDPCVLVVAFRLRAVRGLGHAAFRW